MSLPPALPPATPTGSGASSAARPGPGAAHEVDLVHLLVSQVQDYALFLLDPEGRVVSWNDGAQRLKGYAAGDIIGRSFEEFYTREDRAGGKPRRLLEAARRDGRVEDEGWRVRRDGTLFWADVVITALHDEAGRLRGFGKVTRDLTERRAAELALRRSEEAHRLLVDSVEGYAILSLDADGRVTTWNRGAQALKGYAPADILGRSFEVFYTPEDRAEGKPRRLLAQALRDGRAEDEGWRVRQDGTLFWADVVISPIFDERGAHRGFSKVTRDLTDRRAAEELRRANERLRELHHLKNQFINTVSHELRTPLTPVMLQLDVLRSARPAWGPGEQRGFDILERNLRRLAALVEDVLEAGRLEDGRLRLHVAPVDLAAVARESVDTFAAAAHEKGVQLRLDAPHPVRIEADAKRVGQVLANLLSNAVRFTPRGKAVRVRVRATPDGAEVAVEDEGIGFTEVQRQGMFQPFAQVHADRSSAGTGLGLFISRGLVEHHGGSIAAASPGPGKGATFTVALPARPAVPQERAPGEAAGTATL